ncbi:PaaI family thioesterase [Pseudonocardia pini]|uniref:PaaI family thioesterase n=1 Tax=Pseudonocardia pini TaxID=2758030 RepID=UPI0015F0C751|nr:PaaI family thioesterase [Pseudonocardia pini]
MTEVEVRRERTHTWQDPAGMAAAVSMSGMEVFTALLAGELPPPPILSLVGFDLDSFTEGRVVFRMTPGEHQYNPLGTVHGGVYATLLDSAMGCAVHTTLPAGVGYTSLDLDVKFLRPMTATTGEVKAIGWVVNSGRRTALARAELRDSADRLLADASSSCLLLR